VVQTVTGTRKETEDQCLHLAEAAEVEVEGGGIADMMIGAEIPT